MRRAVLLAGALVTLGALPAHAGPSHRAACSASSARAWGTRESVRRPEAWPRPLDRLVAFDLGELTLGRALDQVASSTGVRLSYSPDLVPTGRDVCLSVAARPLGEVLVTLLAGTGVLPVVVGSREVVLAPARSAAGSEAAPVRARSTQVLERVLVTGTATGAPERATPFAVSSVERGSLQMPENVSLASVLDAGTPGLWMWTQSPVMALARYGSIRGASSFGVSAPKIYVDGIEVANPLLLTVMDPEQIQRIEVIRGPQGAALYGADAISGVVNIQTRHDGADGGATQTTARVTGGNSSSAYASGGVLAQEHGATMRTGTAARSASLGVSLSTLGEFTPGASARQMLASASMRRVGERLIVTGTGRFEGTNARSPLSPVLRAYLVPSTIVGDSSAQRVRQYTLGGTATFQASERWTHAATLGVDGYRLSGVSGDPTPLPSLSDSALQAARGGADRLTARYSLTHRLGAAARSAFQWTLGIEQSTARERSSGIGTELATRPDGQGTDSTGGPRGDPVSAADSSMATEWWNNTGVFLQAQVGIGDALFLSGGARVEHVSGPSESGRFAGLPMLGASWVSEQGAWTFKLRTAYGRGIRPARTVARGASFSGGHGRSALASLAPEEQAGVEAGVDALWGQWLALHITRFDQRASGLVQPVAILGANGGGGGRPGDPQTARVLYQLQNVGAIDNRGWELQGTSTLGPVSLTGTVSLVDSRVARLASGYGGDLHEGDRLLEVPARTVGLQAGWTHDRWTLNGSLARASDWINYDQVALAQSIATDPTGLLAPVGQALRAYWRGYDGVTRVNAGATLRLHDRTSLTLTGANLLNEQLGEPDNITVVPGRSLIFGLRSTF